MFKHNNRTLANTADDEPIFVLAGRDPSAPATIMHWIAQNLTTAPDEKLREAFEWALTMRDYQPKKLPGQPWPQPARLEANPDSFIGVSPVTTHESQSSGRTYPVGDE